jgi:exonuclease III
VSRLRLLAWNIRQGGGARLAAITEAIARHQADIVVISEYRGGDSGTRLREGLAAIGYRYFSRTAAPAGRSGVLIAARRRFRHYGPLGSELPEQYLVLAVELRGIRLCGIYMPNLLAKVPYWEALIAAMTAEAGGAALAIGDFNTCRAYVDEPGAIDRTAHFIEKIEAIGFCDLWRQRNPEGRSSRGTATGATGFASTTRSCRRYWRREPARSTIRTRRDWPACRTIRR